MNHPGFCSGSREFGFHVRDAWHMTLILKSHRSFFQGWKDARLAGSCSEGCPLWLSILILFWSNAYCQGRNLLMVLCFISIWQPETGFLGETTKGKVLVLVPSGGWTAISSPAPGTPPLAGEKHEFAGRLLCLGGFRSVWSWLGYASTSPVIKLGIFSLCNFQSEICSMVQLVSWSV